jgi:hypothetical protein
VKTCWMIVSAWCLSLGLATAQTRELVLFPFVQGAAVQPTEEFNVNVEVLNALYAQMKEIPNIYVLRFRETNPSITRAIEENRIRRDRLNPPFNEREADGSWRAARVGAIMGVDLAFAGRIEEFQLRPHRARGNYYRQRRPYRCALRRGSPFCRRNRARAITHR